ncbi:CatB-related O-acetyltransferase [Aeromicrobium ginsengisoli]|uniref:CatB-related O-acetyltransferase n=1 Tax=Aeromicrobium ginsengisoli TaxID=363867 RepID=A0A5M4FDW6_9ACTN|nr:CatB-related O-acetyltransferase [Aeromicrobium ginsengisoli]KAA1396090.1 CatB-related O-acetyltransferase [Aeromicrobium ginsengisoli]
MKNLLRRLLYTYRRVHSMLVGPDNYTWKRLVKSGRVVQGPQTYGIPAVLTYYLGTERLLVGNYSSLGGTYLLGGKHSVENVTTYPHRINFGMEGMGTDGYPTPTGDTHVGSDVWTCAGSFMMSGITIGDGAIIAAGSVVTRDVPPYAIVGGNPAKLIRYRFTPEQIEALLEIKWWDWPLEEVREAVPMLAQPDIDAFIDYARSKKGATAS